MHACPCMRTYVLIHTCQFAGSHEKEALRKLGFCVKLNGADMGPGNGVKGAEHLPEALRVLWSGDDVGNLPVPCPEPKSYLELWLKGVSCSEVLRRARLHLKAAPPIISQKDVKQAMQHLLEAVYCRRLDMWVWEAVNRAVAAYKQPGSVEYQADSGLGPTRVKRMVEIVQKQAKSAFVQGLTVAAAVDVALGAAAAARASYAAQPLNGVLASEKARQHARQAIADALVTGSKPAGLVRQPIAAGALLQGHVWAGFVAASQIDPAHREMHDALFSCLSEFKAEFKIGP